MYELSTHEIDKFYSDGFLQVKNVFPSECALNLQNEIWKEMEDDFGISKHNVKTWKVPPHSPRRAKYSSLNDKVINDNFKSIIDQLLGKDNWCEPKSWGGYLVTFPTPENQKWKLTHDLWHWDYELFRGFELKGLIIFSFYSKVKTQGGGTLVVSGSHTLLHKYYNLLTEDQKKMKHGKQRNHFFNHYPWFRKLTNPGIERSDRKSYFMDQPHQIDGLDVQVIELTGDPGDVVFCHPRLIHAPAGINLSSQPRFMRVKFLW